MPLLRRAVRAAALAGAALALIPVAWGAPAYQATNPDRCDLRLPYAVLHELPFADPGFSQGFHIIVCGAIPAFATSGVADDRVGSISIANGAVAVLAENPENSAVFPGHILVTATDVPDLAPAGLDGRASSFWLFPAGSHVAGSSGTFAELYDRHGARTNGVTMMRTLVSSGRVVAPVPVRAP